MGKTGNVVPTITKAEHIGPDDTGDNIEAKRVALYGADTTGAWSRMSSSFGKLVSEKYDFIDLGYDGSNRLTSVVFKTGGSGGTTVATLAITYISTSSRIDTVTKT